MTSGGTVQLWKKKKKIENKLKLVIWTALKIIISETYLRLASLYQWQHLVVYERQQSANRQRQLNLYDLILQNSSSKSEILENNINILMQYTFCVLYFGWFPRRLNCMCRRFGTLFHLHRWCTQEECSSCVHHLWR